jgi:hypothetical protein
MLKDVLIEPGLSRNLLSVIRLVKSKIEGTFMENGVLFVVNRKRSAHSELRSNLFVMSGESVNQRAQAFACKVKFGTLHRQLNHRCAEKIKRQFKKKNITVSSVEDSKNCEICSEAKHTRRLFSQDIQVLGVLSVVCSD